MEIPSYEAQWQSVEGTAGAARSAANLRDCASGTLFVDRYPVTLIDGSRLELPLRPLPGGDSAVALLMSNQTSFRIERLIVERLTDLVRPANPESVVGIPTLGLTYARAVAEAAGLPDFVPLGHSRKFWYDDAFSETAFSFTSPEDLKRMYLDPALLQRVQGKRVVVVDDVLNTGNTMTCAIALLRRARATIAGIVVVLTEGWLWHDTLARIDPSLPGMVRALGHIPMFKRVDGGWKVVSDTDVGARQSVEAHARPLGRAALSHA